MSTTATKRSYVNASADALAFRELFPSSCYQVWEFAGSLRRCKREVGDVEHVIIPVFGNYQQHDGLFVEEKHGNLLWHRLDQLVEQGVLSKHVYGKVKVPQTVITPTDIYDKGPPIEKPVHRWGEKYRGVDFRGFNHEIFLADLDNLGPTLAIRTGPWEFSKMLVSSLPKRGLVNEGGYVRPADKPDQIISCPTEEEYFKLCGIRYLPPEKRF
jgi:DNA polymerase/3'-5' exonuclease PolX